MTDKTSEDRYKDTVFLPKTDFPMRAGLPQKEPEILAKWQEMDIYKRQRKESAGRPKWILHWGPPYANGGAHIGHAFTKSLKDIVNRTWQSRGYDAPMVPGWDCHGLPIEWKIEEQYRNAEKDKDEISPVDFRGECREFAKKWVDVQREDFKRLGVLADFDDPYLTMDFKSEGRILQEIHKFLKNGLLYRGVKPVMWSVVEQTALAEAEIEYKDHKSITVWVKFPVKETKCDALQDTSIVIWTTTPWTLPSNRALAFGENIEYGVYEVKALAEHSKANVGDKVALAVSLADAVKEGSKVEEWDLISTFKGSDVEGTVCAHPLAGQGYDFDVRALSADFVTEDAGTGFVHIAPGHGADDFYLGQANNVEVTDNVTDDGKYREHVPLFAGMEVYTEKGEMGGGNFAVLKALDEAGALFAKGSLRHEYPHSWRSKAPLIFRTTPQWFIAMDKPFGDANKTLREVALDEIAATEWVPGQGENRIRAMIEQRPDWCISRQRLWGVPIAIFVNKETNEPLNDDAVLGRIGQIFEEEGCDAWWTRDASDFLGDKYNPDDYDQVFDVVDVWFDSASTHAFVVEDREELHWPADLYLEGSDQHRGWFHTSLLESCGTRGKAPYKSVLTHGFVLDDKGYKMSKSLGNVIAPEEVLKEYGADILRLWTIMSDYADDVRMGKDALKNASDIYRRFRNTFRFLLGALEGFEASQKIDEAQLPALENYVLAELAFTENLIKQDLGKHDYSKVIMTIHNFCNSFLSSFYFDIRKDSLYCDSMNDPRRSAALTVMSTVFDCVLSWLSPILCFTTEEVWSHSSDKLYKATDSVHLRDFPTISDDWRDGDLEAQWGTISKVRRVVLGALEIERKAKTIGSSLEAAPVIYIDNDDIVSALKDVDMAEVCIVSGVKVENGIGPEEAFRIEGINDIAVVFEKAEGEKCQRCWQILPDVGSVEGHEGVCARCAEAADFYFKEQKAA